MLELFEVQQVKEEDPLHELMKTSIKDTRHLETSLILDIVLLIEYWLEYILHDLWHPGLVLEFKLMKLSFNHPDEKALVVVSCRAVVQ